MNFHREDPQRGHSCGSALRVADASIPRRHLRPGGVLHCSSVSQGWLPEFLSFKIRLPFGPGHQLATFWDFSKLSHIWLPSSPIFFPGIPGSGRSPGAGNGNPCSVLAWRIPCIDEEPGATVHGVARSDMTEQLSKYTCMGELMKTATRHYSHLNWLQNLLQFLLSKKTNHSQSNS